MKTEGLHPEALIELERRGRVSDADRIALDQHLQECPACFAEMWAHSASAHERNTGGRDFDLDQAAVDAALRTPAARTRQRRRTWQSLAWVMAAAFPLSAMAAFEEWHASRNKPIPNATMATASAPITLPTKATAEVTAVTEGEPEPAAAPSPLVVKARGAELPGPGALFRRAGELERSGDSEGAVRVYRVLQQRFPSSSEAKLSYAIAGQLLLDEHKYGVAMSQFDQYLATSGPASEEALVGRALSLQGLGQKGEELAAWRSLLREFPASVYADRARNRLTELRGP